MSDRHKPFLLDLVLRAERRWPVEQFHRRRYYSVPDWNAAMDAAARAKMTAGR